MDIHLQGQPPDSIDAPSTPHNPVGPRLARGRLSLPRKLGDMLS